MSIILLDRTSTGSKAPGGGGMNFTENPENRGGGQTHWFYNTTIFPKSDWLMKTFFI